MDEKYNDELIEAICRINNFTLITETCKTLGGGLQFGRAYVYCYTVKIIFTVLNKGEIIIPSKTVTLDYKTTWWPIDSIKSYPVGSEKECFYKIKNDIATNIVFNKKSTEDIMITAFVFWGLVIVMLPFLSILLYVWCFHINSRKNIVPIDN